MFNDIDISHAELVRLFDMIFILLICGCAYFLAAPLIRAARRPKTPEELAKNVNVLGALKKIFSFDFSFLSVTPFVAVVGYLIFSLLISLALNRIDEYALRDAPQGQFRMIFEALYYALSALFWALGALAAIALYRAIRHRPRPFLRCHPSLYAYALMMYAGVVSIPFFATDVKLPALTSPHCEQLSATGGIRLAPLPADAMDHAPFKPGDRIQVLDQGWQIPPEASGYCRWLLAMVGATGTVAAVGTPVPADTAETTDTAAVPPERTVDNRDYSVLIKWDAQPFQELTLEGLLTNRQPFLRTFLSEMPHSILSRVSG